MESDADFLSRYWEELNWDTDDADFDRLFTLARRAAVQWRPIEEAPGGTMSLYWSTWAENGEPGCQLRYYPGIRTTHWMPLPPPPEKGE